MFVNFEDIPVGAVFVYDGDTFRKTTESIAWEYRNGRKYKEWAFKSKDRCKIAS